MKFLYLTFILSFVLHASAQEYKAPKIKLPKKVGAKEYSPKKAQWNEYKQFRVQEKLEADRNLASDEATTSNPASDDWKKNFKNSPDKSEKEPKNDERIIPWKVTQ